MSDKNNNFRELKQLLKLKQHEVPPPGYFNHFSGDVMSRIRAGETGAPEGLLARLDSGSLMSGLLQLFQAKPGVIGGFATSLCLLLLFGVVMADRSDETSASGDMAGGPSIQGGSSPMGLALLPSGNSGISVSTNPIVSLQPVAALFGSQQNPLFQTAAFMAPAQ
jgi:hypothetical protein